MGSGFEIDDTVCHFSFDMWLTLIRSNPLFKPKRDALFKSFFAIREPVEKVAQVIRQHDLFANKTSEITGRHVYANQLYCLALHDLGINVAELTQQKLNEFQAEADELFMKYKPVLIDSDIHRFFKAIKNQGKTISILSNTAFISGAVLRQLLEHHELSTFFSFQLYSDETGFAKPDFAAFHLVFRHAAAIRPLSKSAILHIGDNPAADYRGAINYGFKAMLI
ncbi:HAD family hydrolase [Chitinophaga sedimenti]|uniref:HAD family hydrolase n=1 Tax=Chitinophaga sedimenti TaxID=2033606 RepID=UPI0020055CEE|nr:HAD family hydrolase [Chitinophaga sedimenti]MCK7553990.1 HAD family hydrolase [Chitinophaga sedimenti]